MSDSEDGLPKRANGSMANAAGPAEGEGGGKRRSLRKSLSSLVRGSMVGKKSSAGMAGVREDGEAASAGEGSGEVDPTSSPSAKTAGVIEFISDLLGRGQGASGGSMDGRLQSHRSRPAISMTFDEGQRAAALAASMVKVNVGGEVFASSLATMLGGDSKLLGDLFRSLTDDEAPPVPRDGEGNLFVDHDPRNFKTILNFIRANTATMLPEVGSREWNELRLDADFFGVPSLIAQMDRLLGEEQARREEAEAAAAASAKNKAARRKSSTTDLIQKQGRELERMRVELHRLQFEKARAEAEGRPMFAKMEFAYNLMVVGVTGNGKSSSLNTILDKQVCEVSGAQAQGTRGCNLRDGVIDNTHFISYLDTQGLGADTSVTDEELLEQIMLSAESIRQMGIINNILISFDLATRTTPASIANQLTLCELFAELRRSCFVCLTKWNSPGVMSDWNQPLKNWVKKYRKAKSLAAITEDPPSASEMYRCYTTYLSKSLGLKEDGGAFAKMCYFLTFFESRVIWAYNLDPVLWEDKAEGELEPFVEFLYAFYRKKALVVLKRGSTVIKTTDLAFLKDDKDTMADVAGRLTGHRDKKISALEEVGNSPSKCYRCKNIFLKMANKAAGNIENLHFDVSEEETRDLLRLIGSDDAPVDVGCAMS